MQKTAIDISLLRVRLNPATFDFDTTETCPLSDGFPTQSRAVRAISFGASVRGSGFNIFAMGPRGVGKRAALRAVIEERAATAEPYDDWVYVNNFLDYIARAL